MGSGRSMKRPTQHIARKVAEDIYKTKKQGGKIVLVGGPAIVHTGASDSIATLIKFGFIDAVLAGNALAVHDIEYSTLGTSLGMNVRDGTLAIRGHRNHMQAINSVFKAGSISKMVQMRMLTKGIMYECVRKNVPFVLAGSLRDDGPLPDTITDMNAAQDAYAEQIKGAGLVLCLGSMLHSIATGNMLPSWVKIVCVDINPAVATKVSDRGTGQAVGVVADVGLFLDLLSKALT